MAGILFLLWAQDSGILRNSSALPIRFSRPECPRAAEGWRQEMHPLPCFWPRGRISEHTTVRIALDFVSPRHTGKCVCSILPRLIHADNSIMGHVQRPPRMFVLVSQTGITMQQDIDFPLAGMRCTTTLIFPLPAMFPAPRPCHYTNPWRKLHRSW